VGQGGKTTLATAPDADILREIVCLLTQRVRAGRATFLVKVKSHRGEPINERADTLAEEGRAISDEEKRWDDRTDRMTFEVRKGDTTATAPTSGVGYATTNCDESTAVRFPRPSGSEHRLSCDAELGSSIVLIGCPSLTIGVDEQHTQRLPKTSGVGQSAGGKNSSSKVLDRTCVVSPQPTPAAGVEGRN
jgi:hypothetical protein